MTKGSKSEARQRAIAAGYRSGLEEKVAEQIQAAGHQARYEQDKISYERPASSHTYRPDFPLENGIIIETKGRLTAEDRRKHLLIKKQHPHLDIRFVFSRSATTISKRSKTTYAAWCEKHGFLYSLKGVVPEEWFE